MSFHLEISIFSPITMTHQFHHSSRNSLTMSWNYRYSSRKMHAIFQVLCSSPRRDPLCCIMSRDITCRRETPNHLSYIVCSEEQNLPQIWHCDLFTLLRASLENMPYAEISEAQACFHEKSVAPIYHYIDENQSMSLSPAPVHSTGMLMF